MSPLFIWVRKDALDRTAPFKYGVLHIDDIAVLQRLPRIRIDQVENDRRQEQDRIIPDDLREKAVLTADEHLVGQPQQILGRNNDTA